MICTILLQTWCVLSHYETNSAYMHAACVGHIRARPEVVRICQPWLTDGSPWRHCWAITSNKQAKRKVRTLSKAGQTGTEVTRLFTQYVPWALKCGSSARCLLTVYWEERWEQPLEEIKQELGVWDAPPVRYVYLSHRYFLTNL
jgi:hypothetical protein